MPAKRFVLIIICGTAVSGCAPISRESCINDSAFDIGYQAAMDNADSEVRRLQVSKVCAKQGRDIEMAAFLDGFRAGTGAFCVPENGYRRGLQGRGYNGVCADPAFGAAYEDGLRIHRIEQRRTAIRDRLTGIRYRLAVIAKSLEEDKSQSDERIRELKREEDRLLLERSDLLAEQRNLPSF